MSQLGSLTWAAQADGRLTLFERLRVLGQGLGVMLKRRGKQEIGVAEASLAERLRAPSTKLAAFAERTCANAAPEWLVNHSLRAFAWGSLLAERDGVAVDRECLWLSALLHDLGLTTEYRAPTNTCFAVHGARTAERLLVANGADAERALNVAEAICQHLNVKPDAASSTEVKYLHAGIAFDVVGMRFQDLDQLTTREVHTRHPRLDVRDRLPETLGKRASEESGTRIATLCRFGFLRQVRGMPFA